MPAIPTFCQSNVMHLHGYRPLFQLFFSSFGRDKTCWTCTPSKKGCPNQEFLNTHASRKRQFFINFGLTKVLWTTKTLSPAHSPDGLSAALPPPPCQELPQILCLDHIHTNLLLQQPAVLQALQAAVMSLDYSSSSFSWSWSCSCSCSFSCIQLSSANRAV